MVAKYKFISESLVQMSEGSKGEKKYWYFNLETKMSSKWGQKNEAPCIPLTEARYNFIKSQLGLI